MVSISEQCTETSPFHSTDHQYHSTSTSVLLSTPSTSQSLRNDTATKSSKLRSTDDDLVKSDAQKKKRFSVSNRLKKLVGRFGKDSSTSTPTSTSPTSASGSRQLASGSGPTANLNSRQSAGETTPSSTPPPVSNQRQTDSMVPETHTDGEGPIYTNEPEQEVTTLAKEIQHLVDSLPLPHHSPNSTPSSPLTLSQQSFPLSPYPPEISLPTATSSTDDSPQSQPQPQLKDSRLIALLSNASFMNGSSLNGKPSIWSILENIHRNTFPNPNTSNSHLAPTPRTAPDDSQAHPLKANELPPSLPPPPLPSNLHHSNESSLSIFSDTSSIMVYSPLFPTQSDFVELAELVPVEAEAETTEVVERDVAKDRDVVGSGLESEVASGKSNVGGSNTQDFIGGGTSWPWMWPFSIWYGPDQAQQSVSQTLAVGDRNSGPERRSPESITSPQAGTSNNIDTSSLPPPTTTTTANQRIRSVKSQKSIHAWVPSSSKISVQAFWWGYRLYLPPPILEILSDKTLEATKRSAVITTALTWFFNNLPIDAFPPPMRPGLIILQRLVPFLGYIGTFISWSWSTISSYDVGYGVTLTATWILPVALIPGTWYERDFPKSPIPNSPIPLSPRPLSMQSFVVPPGTPTTDHYIPTTSTYTTPMSSVVPPLPDVVLDGEHGMSSTMWSSPSPLPLPREQSLLISSPIYYPTMMISPNPPNSLCFTPKSPIPGTVQSQTSTPTLPSPPLSPNLNPSSTIPSSPQSRRIYIPPRFNTRVRSSSPSISSHSSSSPTPPPLMIHNVISPSTITQKQPTTPLPLRTPIPIPPTPIELPPIPPEPPLSPKLVNRLLRGPVLQTVPLPHVE